MAATSRVPDRTSRSWPPPCSSGVHSASRRSSSAPAPIGPPSLCPVIVSASTPLAAKSTGTCPTACTASVCSGTPTSCATAASAGMSLTVPISLLAHMTLATATSVPSPSAVGQRRRGDPAARLDRQPGDLGAVVLGQPLDAVQDGVVLGRADDDPAAAGVGLPAGPEQPLDREVVALGAAAGEQHLRRPGTERLGQPLARLLGDAAGGAAARVQRGGVAHPAQLLGHRGQHLGEHRRGRRVVQVRHGAASVGAAERAAAAGGSRRRRPAGRPAAPSRGRATVSDGRRRASTAADSGSSPPVAAATSTPTTPMHSADAGDVGDLEGGRVRAAAVLRRLVEQQHADARHPEAHAEPGHRPGQVGRPAADAGDGDERGAGQADGEQDEADPQQHDPGRSGRRPWSWEAIAQPSAPAVSGTPAAVGLYPCSCGQRRAAAARPCRRTRRPAARGRRPRRAAAPRPGRCRRAAAAAGPTTSAASPATAMPTASRSRRCPAYCSAPMPSPASSAHQRRAGRGRRRPSGTASRRMAGSTRASPSAISGSRPRKTSRQRQVRR